MHSLQILLLTRYNHLHLQGQRMWNHSWHSHLHHPTRRIAGSNARHINNDKEPQMTEKIKYLALSKQLARPNTNSHRQEPKLTQPNIKSLPPQGHNDEHKLEESFSFHSSRYHHLRRLPDLPHPDFSRLHQHQPPAVGSHTAIRRHQHIHRAWAPLHDGAHVHQRPLTSARFPERHSQTLTPAQARSGPMSGNTKPPKRFQKFETCAVGTVLLLSILCQPRPRLAAPAGIHLALRVSDKKLSWHPTAQPGTSPG